MGKKSFITMLVALAFTFLAMTTIKYYRSRVDLDVNLDSFPMEKGDWVGNVESLSAAVLQMLNPDQILSASYVNREGAKVQLLIDYYFPQNTAGGIHSPRNCLPGSGWIIVGSMAHEIKAAGRVIPASRFYLRLGNAYEVMDFWYITRSGETSNDFVFKLNTMLSSLSLRPTDKAFVRFVAAQDPKSIAAMEDFERLFVDEIYRHLPF